MTAPRWQDAHGPDWNGLAPGQAWAIPADGPWQARLDRAGRAHVIGAWLQQHPQYQEGYTDFGYWPCNRRVSRMGLAGINGYRRPWHTFKRACRSAAYHERMVIAAKRTEAQAGQNQGSEQ